MTDVVKFCTLGTLMKKVIDNFHSFFLYMLKSRLSRLKQMQSFTQNVGLAGLIFEINGKN